jgi:hypothetical protein
LLLSSCCGAAAAAAAADNDNVTAAVKNVCSTSLPNEEMLFTLAV